MKKIPVHLANFDAGHATRAEHLRALLSNRFEGDTFEVFAHEGGWGVFYLADAVTNIPVYPTMVELRREFALGFWSGVYSE